MSACITADEARALLAHVPAGPYEACHPDDLPGRSIVMGGHEARAPFDAFVVGVEGLDRVALAELFAAAPALAATVIAQADEIATLRAALALSQESLAAAVRDERVTVVDEVARLTRERAVLADAVRAYVEASDAHERAARSGGSIEAYAESAARIVATTEALRALVTR